MHLKRDHVFPMCKDSCRIEEIVYTINMITPKENRNVRKNLNKKKLLKRI
jgi:hypothetical protein